MAIVARFRVATRATGIRRQVFVHVYDDREQLARAHTAARNKPYVADNEIAGGVAIQQGFPWPKPNPGPIVVMRLWTGQLTTRTLAHEATHAAAAFFMMDCLPGWDSRARGIYLGNNEPLAYAVGDLTAEVVHQLYHVGLLPN